uniref:Mannosyltransferase n=1 Tax=Globodera pallida TaxID=36090 RepID=A0A183CKP6_GLOPA
MAAFPLLYRRHGRFSAFVASAWPLFRFCTVGMAVFPLLWHRHGRFCGIGMAAFVASAWPLLYRRHGRFSAFVASAWPFLWHRHGRFSGVGMAAFVASAMAAFAPSVRQVEAVLPLWFVG